MHLMAGLASTLRCTQPPQRVSRSISRVVRPALGGDAAGDTLTGIENIIGSAYADILTGDSAANALTGGDGDDVLSGGEGDDKLIGDTGAAAATAASGIMFGSGGQLLKGQGAGNNSLASAINISNAFSLGADPDIANATAVPHISVLATGDGGVDYYMVTINRPGSAITLDIDYGTVGGIDSFIKLLDAAGNVLTENDDASIASGGAGSASGLDSFLTYTFANAGAYYIAVGTYPGGGSIPAGATYELQVSVSGEIRNNDVLFGGDGNDLLAGGEGGDSIDGGAGIDTADYSTSSAAVTISLADGTGSGGDAAGDTLINIENVTGSSEADTLTGDDGGNILVGMGDDDILLGGGGDDVLIGGMGADFIDGGDGIDTVDYSASPDGITVNFNVGPSGYGGDAAGDDIWNVENIIGSAYDDILIGRAGTNTLIGGAGNDRLDGRSGADILDGGDGVDIVRYSFSSAGVAIDLSGATANAGGDAGGDQISNVESVSGSYLNDTLTGNAGTNMLIGLSGDDVLQGGAGDDVLDGGWGSDLLSGGTGNDTYNVYAEDGDDMIYDEGGTDTLTFADATDATDLWFAQEANNLVIYRLGTTDRVSVEDWFADPANQVETIEAAAFGKVLYAGDVNSLISQMASFAAQVGTDPSAVQPTELPDEYAVAVSSVWHPAA